MIAGIYNASMSVLDSFGASQNYPTLRILSQINSVFNMAVIPIIESISSANGSKKGQILTIKGKGFTSDPKMMQILWDHRLICEVISVDQNTIVCSLQEDVDNFAEGSKDKTEFIGGCGVEYRKFVLSGESVSQMKNMKDFPNNYVYKNNYFELETPSNM